MTCAVAFRELPTGDEVGRLAATLNRMLAALERARAGERRFLADASHELRTPVTSLRGNVEYLRRHGYEEGVVADLAADTERLSLLIEDLLVLSREDAAGAAPEQEVRLDELAYAAAEGDPRLTVDAPAPVRVWGERAALERALANLVENALQYGPPDGRVTISAALDGVARLSVQDEGPGLAEEDEVRAFERLLARPAGCPRLGSRPRDRPGHRRTPRWPRQRERLNVHDRAPRSQRTLKQNSYT